MLKILSCFSAHPWCTLAICINIILKYITRTISPISIINKTFISLFTEFGLPYTDPPVLCKGLPRQNIYRIPVHTWNYWSDLVCRFKGICTRISRRAFPFNMSSLCPLALVVEWGNMPLWYFCSLASERNRICICGIFSTPSTIIWTYEWYSTI